MNTSPSPSEPKEAESGANADLDEVQRGLVPDSELAMLAETFSALADSNRLKILFALSIRPLCVHELADILRVSESAVSQHLRLLRLLRWARGEREGQMVRYFLMDDHVGTLLGLELAHARGA